MSERPSFRDQLVCLWHQEKYLSVGLDAEPSKLPPHLKLLGRYRAQKDFLFSIVDATANIVLAFKPNIAFFEDDPEGEAVLQETVAYIHDQYPNVPVIVDAKRGDIANTNKGYAKTLWERYKFDASTVHSYLGKGTYVPFLNHTDESGNKYLGKGVIAMCKTSNPDAPVIQDLIVNFNDSVDSGAMTKEEQEDLCERLDGKIKAPVYVVMAYRHGRLWEQNPNIGIVVGATHARSFEPVRAVFNGQILIPGIGTQGGDLEMTLRYAPDSRGQGMIINSASAIIFASSGMDYAKVARNKAVELDNQIRQLKAT